MSVSSLKHPDKHQEYFSGVPYGLPFMDECVHFNQEEIIQTRFAMGAKELKRHSDS